MRSRPSDRPRRKLILITPGDPAGIGPEIVTKVLRDSVLRSGYRGPQLVCVGAREGFDKVGLAARHLHELDETALDHPETLPSGKLLLLSAPGAAPTRKCLREGYQTGWSIEKATRLIQAGRADALVTGPISKERLQQGGYIYSGHTDFLAALCGVPEVTMMLANDQLRVTLVTVHTALKNVPAALTRAKLRLTVEHTADSLRKWWGIATPRIAIAALNPHAGEGGLFGGEEARIIQPEVAALRRSMGKGRGTLIGPLPADTLFANHLLSPRKKRFDAVVCMYHDQGLIPVKLLDFRKTVNVTLGLPIIRTSVDHGVAFDIAGKNRADPSSLRAAIELAVNILKRK